MEKTGKSEMENGNRNGNVTSYLPICMLLAFHSYTSELSLPPVLIVLCVVVICTVPCD